MTRITTLVLVVRDLEQALAVYEQGLGLTRVGEVRDVPSLGARQATLGAGNCVVELLEPHDDTKPPGLFLAERGEGVFALTVGVDDPGRVRERLGRVGVEVVYAREAPPGHPASRCWVRPRDAQGVLVEVGPVDPEPE